MEFLGKVFNYKGDYAQNFVFVFLFTSLSNFKWASEFVLNTIFLLFNLEFSLKYHSRDIMDGFCIRFVLSDDLGNVNSRHEFISVYVECDCLSCWWWYWYEMMLMMILRWDDVDVDNDIEMRWCWCWWCHCDDVCCVCTWGVQWPSWMSLVGEIDKQC